MWVSAGVKGEGRPIVLTAIAAVDTQTGRVESGKPLSGNPLPIGLPETVGSSPALSLFTSPHDFSAQPHDLTWSNSAGVVGVKTKRTLSCSSPSSE